jgi:hypothetical protein
MIQMAGRYFVLQIQPKKSILILLIIIKQSIVFGIRELTFIEMERFCPNKTFSPPIIDEPQNFSSNYEIRTYLSACYYLDSNYQWQSEGLLVRFLDIVVISNFCLGWTIDKSLSNTMFVYTFNKDFLVLFSIYHLQLVIRRKLTHICNMECVCIRFRKNHSVITLSK